MQPFNRDSSKRRSRAPLRPRGEILLIWRSYFAVPPFLDIALCQQAATSHKYLDTFGDKIVCSITFRQVASHRVCDFGNHESHFRPRCVSNGENSLINLEIAQRTHCRDFQNALTLWNCVPSENAVSRSRRSCPKLDQISGLSFSISRACWSSTIASDNLPLFITLRGNKEPTRKSARSYLASWTESIAASFLTDIFAFVVVITTTLTRTNRVPRIVRRPSGSPPRKYPMVTATIGFTYA
jgi:hypothetical protein